MDRRSGFPVRFRISAGFWAFTRNRLAAALRFAGAAAMPLRPQSFLPIALLALHHRKISDRGEEPMRFRFCGRSEDVFHRHDKTTIQAIKTIGPISR